MNILHAILLSIVEGLTEFLPISSTGHLILSSKILGITQTDFVKTFEIAIQMGAILSVVYLYRSIFLNFKKIEIWKKIFVAFIPSSIIGLIFYKLIKTYFIGNTNIVVIALVLGGIFLILFEKLFKKEIKKNVGDISKISYKSAFLIGVFQSISVIPGVSRSAATIIGGMFNGFNREEAVEFSFLLAVPTMIAATVLDLVKSDFVFADNQIVLLLIGIAGSFFVALIAIKYLLKYVQKNDFTIFGIYRIIVGILFFVFVR